MSHIDNLLNIAKNTFIKSNFCIDDLPTLVLYALADAGEVNHYGLTIKEIAYCIDPKNPTMLNGQATKYYHDLHRIISKYADLNIVEPVKLEQSTRYRFASAYHGKIKPLDKPIYIDWADAWCNNKIIKKETRDKIINEFKFVYNTLGSKFKMSDIKKIDKLDIGISHKNKLTKKAMFILNGCSKYRRMHIKKSPDALNVLLHLQKQLAEINDKFNKIEQESTKKRKWWQFWRS